MKKTFGKGFIFLLPIFGVLIFLFNAPCAFASTIITTASAESNIEEDTVWDVSHSPYIIQTVVSVYKATLTIEPGVVVKFDPSTSGAIMVVFGALIVNGEADNKVYFTSIYDDTLGGDTDKDSVCAKNKDEGWVNDGELFRSSCEKSSFNPSLEDRWELYFYGSSNNYINNAVLQYSITAIELYHSDINLKNTEIFNSLIGVQADESSIDANGINCTDIDVFCLIAKNSSNVNWKNSVIKNVGDNAIYINSGSSFNADNLQIENVSGVEDIYATDGSHLTLNHSSFKDCPIGSCVLVSDEYGTKNPSSLDIENSSFLGGQGDGIDVFSQLGTMTVNIHFSVIKNFEIYNVAYSGGVSPKLINAENNFWGDKIGPYIENLDSLTPEDVKFRGLIPYYGVNYIPWCEDETCKVHEKHNPVILIPGIMGTQILKNYDDNGELWPNANKMIMSLTDDFMNDLSLEADGTENPTKPMQLGDIMRSVAIDTFGIKYTSHTFDGLIDSLKDNGYVEGTDLFVFPYDWRKSNIVNAILLKDKVEEILTQTGGTKVDIVAHSMGGLVAKKYIAENSADKIGKLVFIGTPHLGAPKAFKVLMYGDDMGIRFGFSFLNPNRVKTISQNMPSTFELLPSRKFVDGEPGFTGVKYITDLVTPRLSKPGSTINTEDNYDLTKNLMISQGRNPVMFQFSESLHDSIDDLDLKNVNTFNFIGCGATKTIGHITVTKKKSWTSLGQKLVDDYKLGFSNGDDTVPLNSSIGSSGERYYVRESSHSALPSASGLKESIVSILKGEKPNDFDNVSSDINDCFISGKIVSMHSDSVVTNVYDAKGNHTGPIDKEGKSTKKATPDANVEKSIPNVQYEVIEGNTFVFLPTGGNYKIVNSSVLGSGGGVYNVYIDQINGNDNKTGSVYFDEIPIKNPETTSQIDLDLSEGKDGNTVPTVEVDENGDGTFENTISPTTILDANSAGDVIPPASSNSVSQNSVLLSSTDDNSGVLKIEYSLDGGGTWIIYKDPIEIHPTVNSGVTIEYFSTDKAGNVEEIQSIYIPKLLAPISTPIVFNNVPTRSSGGRWLPKDNINPEIVSSVVLPVTNMATITDMVENINKTTNNTVTVKIAKQKNIKNKISKQNFDLGAKQSASVVNSQITIKSPYWIFLIIGGLPIFFIAKKFIKYKIKKQ